MLTFWPSKDYDPWRSEFNFDIVLTNNNQCRNFYDRALTKNPLVISGPHGNGYYRGVMYDVVLGDVILGQVEDYLNGPTRPNNGYAG